MARLNQKEVRLELVANLVPADWNYKSDGTPEMIEKLKNSIEQDESAGVLAIRHLKNGKLEVIDGNHRLKAVQLLGWTKVWVEDFGTISKAAAVVISKRRNDKWFDTDNIKLAQLFRDDVLKEFNVDDLAKIMPETRTEIENIGKLLDFNWDQFRSQGGSDDPDHHSVSFKLSQAEYDEWKILLSRIKEHKPDVRPEAILLFLIREGQKASNRKLSSITE